MKSFSLALRSLTRKPGRTLSLILLTAFLALSVFGGSTVIFSLQRGLESLEGRLGADIILVPAEAESKVSLKNMLLQGTIGSFYMDGGALQKVRETEGVEKASGQIFLASMKADCCSVRIQVIGFDPETDFVVQPWIAESWGKPLEDGEVVVGCRVETEVGNNFRIYDRTCRVVARLGETGTGLDTAVYCNMPTIHMLLEAAEAKGITHGISTGNDADVISAIYVKVLPGADIGQVNTRLNGRIRRATAVKTAGMMSEVADSLAGVSGTVRILIAAVWVLALGILLIAYAMMTRERRRELAVYRLLGMSRRKLAGEILRESFLVSLAGAMTGIAAGALVIFPFTAWIETRLSLPWLTPGAGRLLACGGAALAVTVAAGCLASLRTALRLSRTDAGNTLREGA